jgi:hypothetical protein
MNDAIIRYPTGDGLLHNELLKNSVCKAYMCSSISFVFPYLGSSYYYQPIFTYAG